MNEMKMVRFRSIERRDVWIEQMGKEGKKERSGSARE